MKLGRTKCSYMRTAAWFVDKQMIDMNESSYWFSIDETENQAHKKELQIKIKYYSETHQRRIQIHGTKTSLGMLTVQQISTVLKNSCTIIVGMDGPNIHKAINSTVTRFTFLTGLRWILKYPDYPVAYNINLFLVLNDDFLVKDFDDFV